MCLFLFLQLCHSAYHLQVPPWEQPHWQTHYPLCAACRSHHQHGRHRTLRGRGSHLYRPSEQLWARFWTDHYNQVILAGFMLKKMGLWWKIAWIVIKFRRWEEGQKRKISEQISFHREQLINDLFKKKFYSFLSIFRDILLQLSRQSVKTRGLKS